MPVVPLIPYIVMAASAVAAASAKNKQAKVVKSVADYNSTVDIANAQQLGMDANANIEKQRADDAVYTSSQRAAYAASGVLSGTGSPMEVQATTVGRQEQAVQQYWQNTQQKSDRLYDAAKMGTYEADKQADAFHAGATAEIFKGIGSVANISGAGSGAGAASLESKQLAGKPLGNTMGSEVGVV